LRRRRRVCRIPENGNPSDTGHCFAEQLEPFAGDFRCDIRQSRDVASRSSEAGHEAGTNGITGYRKHDRDGSDRTTGRVRRLRSLGHYRVDLQLRQFGRERREAVPIPPGPPELKSKVPSFRVTQLSQAAPERFHTRVARGVRTGSEESDAPNSGRLLRLDGDRRGDKQEDGRNQPDQRLPHRHHVVTDPPNYKYLETM
jgi:hypothetical protein